MPFSINPAAPLSANKVPYAPGSGRLADSSLVYDSTTGNLGVGANAATIWGDNGRQLIVQSVTGTNPARLQLIADGVGDAVASFGNDVIRRATIAGLNGSHLAFSTNAAGSSGTTVTERLRILANGNHLFGKTSDASNGLLQLNSHSALTGGIAWGADTAGLESIWRLSSGVLRTLGRFDTGNIRVGVDPTAGQNGYLIAGLSYLTNMIQFRNENSSAGARLFAGGTPTWVLPTGTLTRTAFDPATVTLPQLAERVAALITDLTFGGNGHWLLSA